MITRKVKLRRLECGCVFTNDEDWSPCSAHVQSQLYKVRKAHAEIVEMERCENCGADKVPGQVCFQCGQDIKVGAK